MPDVWLGEDDDALDGLIGQRWQDVLLVHRLGTGGVGAIYLALQMPLLMKVAVKFLIEDAPPALAARLQDEAVALSRLHHHHIVRLLKYGVIGKRTFLVMEFVDGSRTLADAIERGELDRAARVRVLRQLIEALEAAHALDVVHRDVKPENIMLTQAPREPHFVKLVDFGLAKFTDGGRESTQLAAGTPTYMAPEQITRRNIGPWTDWYAVAMIALELLLDHRPYAHMRTDEVVRAKMGPDCDPTRGLAEQALPPAVARFFHLALAADPHNRLRTASVFRDAFNEMVRALPPEVDVLEPTMAAIDLQALGLGAIIAEMPDPEETPLGGGPGAGDASAPRHAFIDAKTLLRHKPAQGRERPGHQPARAQAQPAPAARVTQRPTSNQGPRRTLHAPSGDDIRKTQFDMRVTPISAPAAPDPTPLPQARPVTAPRRRDMAREATALVDPLAARRPGFLARRGEAWRTALIIGLLIGLGVLAAVIWLLLNPPLPVDGSAAG